MPLLGGAPDLRVPWLNHPALNYSGLIFAIGGRSLTWGGWSPELLDEEMTAWPATTRADLRARYFAESSRQIGVRTRMISSTARCTLRCASNSMTG